MEGQDKYGRWRDILVRAAKETLRTVVEEINSSQACIREMMECGAPTEEIREEFRTWRAVQAEFMEISRELSDKLSGEDLEIHASDVQQGAAMHHEFVEEIRNFLQARGSMTPLTPGSDQHQTGEPTSSEPVSTPSQSNLNPQSTPRQGEEESPSRRGDRREEPRSAGAQNYLNMNTNCGFYAGGGGDFDFGSLRSQLPPGPHYQRHASPQFSSSSPSMAGIGYRMPVPPTDSSTVLLQRLAEALESRQDRLPPMEPNTFNGELLEFPAWISAFESMIEPRARSQKELLFYLGKYVTGEAKRSIEGVLSVYNNPDAYRQAKEILVSRYGDKVLVSKAFKMKLHAWPVIRRGDAIGLQRYADFLWQCHAAMGSLSYLSNLESREENLKLVQKLPPQTIDRWDRLVDGFLYGTRGEGRELNPDGSKPYPTFEDFCCFVGQEARIARSSSAYRDEAKDAPVVKNSFSPRNRQKPAWMKPTGGGMQRRHAYSQSANTPEEGTDAPSTWYPGPRCLFCEQSHYVSECSKFIEQSTEAKKAFARSKGMCFGCLRRGHRIDTCRYRRPELMEDKPQAEGEQESATVPKTRTMVTYTADGPQCVSSIMPVAVSLTTEDGVEVWTQAMFDTQSDGCFIRSSLAAALGMKVTPARLELTTLSSVSVVDSGYVDGVVIRGPTMQPNFVLPRCYTRDHISCPPESIPTSEAVMKWPHLEHLATYFRSELSNLEVGLLIGYNCSDLFMHSECIVHKQPLGKPYALKTFLGWWIMGPLAAQPNQKQTFRTAIKVKELTKEDMRQAFDAEFPTSEQDNIKLSLEDQRFMNILTENLKLLQDGRVELPFPFRVRPVSLPDSRPVAVKRLICMKRKFQREPQYFEQYKQFMERLLRLGYAEVVPEAELSNDLRWYIPHHGVYHPRKPNKLRVVYDSTAQTEGINLNGLLLSGPDMTNNLAGVLLRFRKEKVGIICDVESMFYQVVLAQWFRDFARFVWFADSDLGRELVDLRMTVHLFGAASSPGCANFALRTIANVHEERFGTAAADFLRRNFYVDDGVISVPTVEQAIALIHASHGICKAGGMNLRSFTSSHPDVLSAIPEELRATSVKDWTPGHGTLPVEPTLGLGWSQEDDSFQYLVTLLQKPNTRRGLLSALSSVYDPLGLIGPVLLVGRLILQKLCIRDFQWDDTLPADITTEWHAWYSQLRHLSTLRIPRCIRVTVSLPLLSVTLHVFCDASSIGFGVACYVQLRDHNRCDTNLIYAKARVAPTKAVTIPRLELQAAVLGVKSAEYLTKELDYQSISVRFWSDSKVVLAYIASEGKRFHLYVHNRVSYIRERTAVADWGYVASEDNPADLSSRGCSVNELRLSELWWHGPAWLADEHYVPELPQQFVELLNPEDPELKKVVNVNVVQVHPMNKCLELLSRWSNWAKIVRMMARWACFVRWLVHRFTHVVGPFNISITAQDLKVAEVLVCRLVQIVVYRDERRVLKGIGYPQTVSEAAQRKQQIKETSNLYRLDPYLSEEGVIRVGGRLRRSYLPVEQVHPCVVPASHLLIKVMIRHYHVKTAHAGRSTTLATIRLQGFWLCGGRAVVGSIVNSCVPCRRLRAPVMHQLMSELPEDRLSPEPPFSHVAVDFFGPYLSKCGRSDQKRYGCLFVCQASRAVHLELAFGLSTDSFLHCYRRFAARRGPILSLRCDQGTNLVGAANELKHALAIMDQGQIQQELWQSRCDWFNFVLNTPRASHMGGSWERLIRSVKSALNGLLFMNPRLLNDEELYTLFAEAEALVNSRPLAVQDEADPTAQPPITPSSLLTMKPNPLLALPGVFDPNDVYARKRWRTVQYLAQCFWNRWLTDYLPNLQERARWPREQPDLTVDSIVLIMDENQPRGRWHVGVVSEVIASQDGRIRRAIIKVPGTGADNFYERPISKLVLLMTL